MLEGLASWSYINSAGPHEHGPHAQSPCESQEGGTMSTGREGHGVPAEPLNSLKYNQPLSLLGQLPGRAETLPSPPAGALQQGQEPWFTN